MKNTENRTHFAKGTKKTPKVSLVKHICRKCAEILKESPRTQLRNAAGTCQRGSCHPVALYLALKGKREGEKGRSSPAKPQVSPPLVRKPSRASETSHLPGKGWLLDPGAKPVPAQN